MNPSADPGTEPPAGADAARTAAESGSARSDAFPSGNSRAGSSRAGSSRAGSSRAGTVGAEITPPSDHDAPSAQPADSTDGPSDRDETVAADSDGFRDKVVRSSMWTVLGYGGKELISFGSNLILTWLLVPEAFGTMAIVNSLMIGLHLFSDVGIGPSIIQNKRGEDPTFVNTAFTIQVIRGVLLTIAGLALAIPAGHFYERPELVAFVAVMSLNGLISGFNSTAIFTLNRKLAVGKIALLEIVQQLAQTLVMVIWALIWPSVWALVAGGLVNTAVRAIWSHYLGGEIRNRLTWDRDCARELFQFGRWVFVSTLLTFLATQCDRLIFGKMIPFELLGIYAIAFRLASIPTQVITRISHIVVFPSFSRIVNDGAALAATYAKGRSLLQVLGGYVVAGMLAAGHSFFLSIYPSSYADSGWMLQLIVIGAWFQILEGPTTAALLALGQVSWMAGGNAARVAGMAVFIPIGFAWLGFPGAILGLSASVVLHYALVVFAAHRHGLPTLGLDLLPTILVAASGLGGYGLEVLMRDAGAAPILRLFATSALVTMAWLPWTLRLYREQRAARA